MLIYPESYVRGTTAKPNDPGGGQRGSPGCHSPRGAGRGGGAKVDFGAGRKRHDSWTNCCYSCARTVQDYTKIPGRPSEVTFARPILATLPRVVRKNTGNPD